MDGEGLTEQAEELELDSAGGREPGTCLSKAVWTWLESEWREGREGWRHPDPRSSQGWEKAAGVVEEGGKWGK